MEEIRFVFIFLIGLAFGSYINVLVDRGSKKKSLLQPSFCDHCGKKLHWFDNVPLFGFFWLKGKSRCCQKPLSWQHPLMELAGGLFFLLTAWQGGFFGQSIDQAKVVEVSFLLFLAFLFLTILLWDWKYLIIPDELVAGGLLVAMAFSLYQYFHSQCSLFSLRCPVTENLLGGLLVGGFFYLLFAFSRGRWIGGGDVKLGFLVGWLIGWPLTYLFFLITYGSGALISLPLLFSKKKSLQSQIPFGPFIVFGAWVVLLWGDDLLAIYHWLLTI